VISVGRPGDEAIGAYLGVKAREEPTYRVEAPPAGRFHRDAIVRVLGQGDGAFMRACDGLDRWQAHRGSGVEVFPADAQLAAGATVAVLTRQMGLWVLAACRVIAVEDGPDVHGFTYATLPDHPECGVESFTVRRVGPEVRFEIEATSRPGVPLVRVAAPVARLLQHRATAAYGDALKDWVDAQA
jgi:uncharacterized protein (UPF0548 family)